MTSNSDFTYVPAKHHQTYGLTPHHHSGSPRVALNTAGAEMPPAWQTRNAPYSDGQRHDIPARSFADIALDPWRFATATTLRKLAIGVVIALLVLTVLF